jgi:hypothetical protein
MSPVDTDHRRALRGAVARGDGAAVITALENLDVDKYLQLAGDGLLIAVAQQAADANTWAQQCATLLQDRGWDGDDELAGLLEAAVTSEATLPLRLLPVDLEDISDVLESGDFEGGALDLDTGEVWTHSMLEYADEIDDEQPDFDDETRWLHVPADGPSEGYRDMQSFISTIPDPSIADRLSIAIDGTGAFRRFRDLLQRWEDIEDDWYRFCRGLTEPRV